MSEKSAKKAPLRAVIATVSAVMLIAAALLGVGIAYGWFTAQDSSGGQQSAVPMSIAALAYFEHDGAQWAVAPDADGNPIRYDGGAAGSTAIDVNVHDDSAWNHMSKLRVSVRYTGTPRAAVRVRLLHFWQEIINGETTYPERADIIFSVGDNFLDNSTVDSAYYYCDKTAYGQLADDQKLSAYAVPDSEVNLINGINQTVPYSAETQLQLSIRSEAVQLNRAEILWKYDNPLFVMPVPAA